MRELDARVLQLQVSVCIIASIFALTCIINIIYENYTYSDVGKHTETTVSQYMYMHTLYSSSQSQ